MQTKQIKYQVAIILILGVYLYYLVYRIRFTINPDSLFLSVSFFYADVHGFISLFLFAFQLWNPRERKTPPVLSGVTVDIYIPTYNEDISVIRKTVLGCAQISYPHTVYILDDGNRSELMKEAQEWGCGYIARKDRSHAKAGNLNHALHITQGEYVVIFDTDCVPQPDFLDKTLGYFHDAMVAFVQTPHNYYNVDSFQFRISMDKNKSWVEQNLFYRLIMPGRDYWNSAFFAGTAAVFRKKALEEIGGFATGSITEDLHTTILLYSRGWKGVYHNEVLSNELAAKDLKNYHVQQLRWAEGNIGMFFKCNPLLKKGLTIPQRICFSSTIFGWLFGFPKAIYLTIPSIAVFAGLNPIQSFDFAFIWRCVLFLVVLIAGFEFVTRGYGKIIYCECFVTMNFFVVIKAAFRCFFGLFGMKSIFKVTGKNTRGAVSVFGLIPQIVIFLLSCAGILWGCLKICYGMSDTITGSASVIFWNTINGLLTFSVIEKTTRPYYKRKDFRFIGSIPVRYTTEGCQGLVSGIGVTKDMNEFGISLVTIDPLPTQRKISLSLYLDQKILQCEASVLFARKEGHSYGMFVHGVKFEELSRENLELMNLYCFNTLLPRFRYSFGRKPSVFLKLIFKCYSHERFRKHVRRKINVPLLVRIKGKTALTVVTHDLSASGLSFISCIPMGAGGVLSLEIITPWGTIIAKGEIVQQREIVVNHSCFIGVKFIHISEDDQKTLLRLTCTY